MTFADMARLASDILGQNVERITVSDEEYRSAKLASGYPEWMVAMLASLFEATRAREFDVVDPTLEGVLGRKPTSIGEVLTTFLQQGGTGH